MNTAVELPGSEQIIRDELSVWPIDQRLQLLTSLLEECRREADAAAPLPALTAAQTRVLRFVCEHIDRHARPPTIREIADGLGFASMNTVKDHLKYIARKGHIVCDYGVSRGIRVLRRPS